MGRARIGTLGRVALVVAVVATAAVAATAHGAGTSMQVEVVNAVETGGRPPKRHALGIVSTSHGRLLNGAGIAHVGTWTYRCRFIGGNGLARETSHFCSMVVAIKDKGRITFEGGIGDSSGAVRWLAITGATGVYRGVKGAARISNFNTAWTPVTFYLIRG